TLTTTVYTAGITPETTLVFKALVVIAVCLLQAPKFRALVFRKRRPPKQPASTANAPAQSLSVPVPPSSAMAAK
ncbi:MAG TPA: ABC transporter permease, partial [Mycobacterium sp.]